MQLFIFCFVCVLGLSVWDYVDIRIYSFIYLAILQVALFVINGRLCVYHTSLSGCMYRKGSARYCHAREVIQSKRLEEVGKLSFCSQFLHVREIIVRLTPNVTYNHPV